MTKLYTLALAALLPLSYAAAQQTLVLNDGTQIQGRLVSSNGDNVVFRTQDGSTRRFRFDELQNLSFTGGAYNDRYNSNNRYNNPDSRYNSNDYQNNRPPAYNSAGVVGAPGYQAPPPGGYQTTGNQVYTRRQQDQNYTTWATLPAGTQISVRTNEQINARTGNNGRTYAASIAQDILDQNGNVLIPQGSDAQLVVRNYESNNVALDLQSISVNGTQYQVNTEDIRETGNGREGLGKNKRTGEYVGGGAVLGTLLGAIAGGGKGALIGAVAGGAAGAGAEVLTKGDSVRVPAESVLTFRLDSPLQLNQARY